jgi:hypothetical protein
MQEEVHEKHAIRGRCKFTVYKKMMKGRRLRGEINKARKTRNVGERYDISE